MTATLLSDSKAKSSADQGATLNNVFGTNRLGPVMNPNGTVVTPGESYADWAAGVTHAADEAGAGAGGFVKNFLEPAGEVLGTVGALGAAVAAAPIAGAVGGVGGAALGGAIGGAATAGLGEMASGKNLSATGIAEGAGLGALGGGVSYGLGPSGLGLSQNVASGLSKAATGAVAGGINGGVNGAIGGSVGGLVSAGAGALGAPSALGNIAGAAGSMAVSPFLAGSPGAPVNTSIQANPYGGLMPNTAGIGATATGASTDSSLASTIGGALPGVLQAGIGTAGSLAASTAMQNADQNAITTQQNNLGNINGIWSTQQQLGQGADTALGSALGTNGQPANYSGFENMPGYQFAVSQGTQAIQRQAAALGNAYTPNTSAAIGQYVTGTASQDYNTYISQLMGAAGLGTTANQGLQTGNQTTANNISTLQQNIGQAQAAGYSGVANSTASLFGVNGAGTGLINAAGKALGGGGGGGGNGGSLTPNSGDNVSGGVDPSTGIPYDIENPSYGTTPSSYDPSNPLGIAGYNSSGVSNPSWSSVTDSGYSGAGDVSSGFNSVTDTGGDLTDGTSFLGDW